MRVPPAETRLVPSAPAGEPMVPMLRNAHTRSPQEPQTFDVMKLMPAGGRFSARRGALYDDEAPRRVARVGDLWVDETCRSPRLPFARLDHGPGYVTFGAIAPDRTRLSLHGAADGPRRLHLGSHPRRPAPST